MATTLQARLTLALVHVLRASAQHSHGTGSWAWAGIFSTPEASHTWKAQKVNGVYAEAHMKMVVLSAAAATKANLESAESEAKHGWAATCTEVEVGETFAPTEDACFELHFGAGAESTFTMNTASAAAVVVFTEHLPTEFESTAHYFVDEDGHDVEAAFQVLAIAPTAGLVCIDLFPAPRPIYEYI